MIAIVLIIVIAYTFILRCKLLKENKEYIYYREIPSDDSPAFVGKIIKGKADGNDIIATILDLSYRGYIKISTEQINNKNKTVLYLEKASKTTELKEHEMFLINKIFSKNNQVVFEDYIKSDEFKQDFKAFDQMIERRIKDKAIQKNSILKNINKMLLLVSYFMFGIAVFYSIALPIVYGVTYLGQVSTKTGIIITLIVSALLYVFVAHKYIAYIAKSTNTREKLILNISYIILGVIIGCAIIFVNYNIFNVLNILNNELNLHNVVINFVLAITVVLYMFNIIKHTEKSEILYYIFLVFSLVAMIFNMQLTMAISILFYISYIFFKSPKYRKLEQDEYIYKWIAFKKYLEDFSRMSEKDSNEIVLWEKYLIYAVSLGINKKIIKKYAKLHDIKMLNEVYLNKVYVEYFE